MRRFCYMLVALLSVACQTAPVAPQVEVYDATQVSESGAVLKGKILMQGSHYVSSREFRYGTDMGLTDCKTVDAGDGDGYFECHLWGLNPGTEYFFKAVVYSNAGSAESQTLMFRTDPFNAGAPKVNWHAYPHEITETSAVMSADIVSDGNDKVTECGFCFASTADGVLPEVGSSLVFSQKAKGVGAFECAMEQLESNTEYSVRAWARNSLGIGYSEVKTFRTLDPARIIDVSVTEFYEKPESGVARYRISGYVYAIVNSKAGLIALADTGDYVYVYNTSRSPVQYGDPYDGEFPELGLREGDKVTLVGYRSILSNGTPVMDYAYVESYTRLKLEDFMGTWTMSARRLSDNFVFTLSGIKVMSYVLSADFSDDMSRRLLFVGIKPDAINSDGTSSSTSHATAEGYYDSNTGRIYILGGSNVSQSGMYYFSSAPDVHYLPLFYPLAVRAGKFIHMDALQYNGVGAYGMLALRPMWDGETLMLGDAGGTGSSAAFRFEDYVYDTVANTPTDQLYNSSVEYGFRYMTKEAQ